jgi:hypothetical protein
MRFWVILIAFLLLLAGLYWKKNTFILPARKIGNTLVAIPSRTPSPKKPAITATIAPGWRKYEDAKLGVDFSVPKEYTLDQNGEYSVMAIAPADKSYPAGYARFFYLSLVPEALKGDKTAQIYNYDQAFLDKLLAMRVGETKNLADSAQQKDWFTYERQEDLTFGNRKAKVFVNRKPWEFPPGTWEYRYIFQPAGKTVIAGGYIEGGPSGAPFTLPVITNIMKTLSIW